MLVGLLDPKLLGTVVTIVGGGFLVANLSKGSNNTCAKPFWIEGDLPNPVMDCQQNGQHYKVLLANIGTIDKTSGGGMSLQLFDVNKKEYINLEGSENQFLDDQGKWLQTAGQQNSWRIFQNSVFYEKISLMGPNNRTSPTVIECQIANVQNNQKKKDLNENIADMKFEIKHCSKADGKEVCDIIIVSPSKKLEWISSFKPQVNFCDLAHHQKL